jgi:hypothetical protein
MQYSRARTRRALVEEALATYVAVKAEERRRATYGERLESLGSKGFGCASGRPSCFVRTGNACEILRARHECRGGLVSARTI